MRGSRGEGSKQRCQGLPSSSLGWQVWLCLRQLCRTTRHTLSGAAAAASLPQAAHLQEVLSLEGGGAAEQHGDAPRHLIPNQRPPPQQPRMYR